MANGVSSKAEVQEESTTSGDGSIDSTGVAIRNQDAPTEPHRREAREGRPRQESQRVCISYSQTSFSQRGEI
jgi:hypothetical protein